MKAKVKIAVDVLMTVLFLMQMGYHMLDNRAHEWTGITLFVLFLVHHLLNDGWHRNLCKGKYSAQRILLTVIDLLLMLCMAAIIASAVLVSRHAFSFLCLHLRSLGRQIHMPATMWGFLLMGLHLGLHWSMMLGLMKKTAKGKTAKWLVLAGRIVLAATCIFGVYQFIHRGLWMELFRLREFAFLEYGESLLYFAASYIAMLVLWAALSHYGQKAVKALSRKHTTTIKEGAA